MQHKLLGEIKLISVNVTLTEISWTSMLPSVSVLLRNMNLNLFHVFQRFRYTLHVQSVVLLHQKHYVLCYLKV